MGKHSNIGTGKSSIKIKQEVLLENVEMGTLYNGNRYVQVNICDIFFQSLGKQLKRKCLNALIL